MNTRRRRAKFSAPLKRIAVLFFGANVPFAHPSGGDQLEGQKSPRVLLKNRLKLVLRLMNLQKKMGFSWAGLMVCALVLSACSTRRQKLDYYKNQVFSLVEDSRFWDVTENREISWPEFLSRLMSKEIVLVGETHTDLAHHLGQAQLVRSLGAQAGQTLAVGFEQIRHTESRRLENYQKVHGDKPQGLESLLKWDASGWPDFEIYLPIFEAAFDTQSRVVGLDLGLHQMQRLKQGNFEDFSKASLRKTKFKEGLPEGLQKSLERELIDSHPFNISDEHLQLMQKLQRARDLQMAESLLDLLEDADRVVGIMGWGHSRNDRGVPWYIHRLAGKGRVLSVAFAYSESKQIPTLVIDTKAFYSDFIWILPAELGWDP